MARIRMDDANGYITKLYKLEDYQTKFIKKSVYKGAGVVTDQIRKEIDSIYNIHHYQREDLKKGLGIASISRYSTGDINTKIGFEGYGSVPTDQYPDGVPNLLLARSIVAGTSFRSKTPFIRRAVTKSKTKAIEAMQKQIDEDVQSIMEK